MATTSTITINTATINSAISGDFSSLITTSNTNGNISQYSVNLANTAFLGGTLIERTPPKDPYSGPFDFAGFGFGLPSTPRTARGVVQGTAIANTNMNLSHGCMIFADFASLLGGGLLGDIQQLLTLPPASIQASAFLRIQFNGIVQELQLAIAAILEAVGLDPTGIISYVYSQAKALLRMINYWLRDIKQLISDIQSIVMFINQLFGIIQYLLSLPAQLLAMVQSCISSFLGSIMNTVKSFESIPATLENQVVGGVLNNFGTFANQSLATITAKSNNYKQNNPVYSNSDITTITPTQIQNLISTVATTDPNTYSTTANTVSNSNGVQASQNSTAYVANAIFKQTANQTLVVGSISYDTVFANNIFANTIICTNAIISQNSLADNAIINLLNANTILSVDINAVPTVTGSGVKLPAGFPNPINGQILYGTIVADSITVNTLICDELVCNNTINVTGSMNTHVISTFNLSTNSTIITT